MRRDASVLPPESPAWEYDTVDRRWWTTDAAGARVWFDEYQRRWRTADDVPTRGSPSWSAVLKDLGSASPERLHRLVHDFVPERHMQPNEFDSLPTTLSTGVGYATAEGLRSAIERAGAVAVVNED